MPTSTWLTKALFLYTCSGIA
uniref:Uncharacterized protein n=1 Tax=Anguilla anguilla TaxID=7936 RepID=A0A0E9R6G8_ANGAN